MADPREITRLVLPGFGAMWATVLRALRAADAPEADRAVGAGRDQDGAVGGEGHGVHRAVVAVGGPAHDGDVERGGADVDAEPGHPGGHGLMVGRKADQPMNAS